MRKLTAFLAALIFLSAFACAETPFSVSLYSRYMVANGTNYSIAESSFGGEPAYILWAGGRAYAVFVPTGVPGRFAPLANETDIASALEESYYLSGYSPAASSGLDEVHSSFAGLSELRRPGEAACRVLLGSDRFPCYDYESCQKACYAVTSFCQPVALGAGQPFIHASVDFENYSRKLDAAYELEKTAYGAWKEKNTSLLMWEYIYAVAQVRQAAYGASQSPLFDGYSFCYSPDYALSNLTSLQIRAQSCYTNASRFLSLGFDSQYAAGMTAKGMQRQLADEAAFNRSVEEGILKAELAKHESEKNATQNSTSPLQNAPLPAPAAIGSHGVDLTVMAVLFAVSFIAVVYALYTLHKRGVF